LCRPSAPRTTRPVAISTQGHRNQTAERNRLLRLLETANIKLASVASDVFGVSRMNMLKALIEGAATANEMAGLAKLPFAVNRQM